MTILHSHLDLADDNIPKDKLILLFDMLYIHKFKLGGSRRMAEKYSKTVIIKPETDWDLYAQHNYNNLHYLQNNGFKIKPIRNSNYCDLLTLQINKHEKYNIDVVLRKRVDIYEKSFESISEIDYITKIWKSSPFIKGVLNKENIKNYFNKLFILNGYKP